MAISVEALPHMPNPSVILLAVVYYIMTAKSILSEPDTLKEVNMTGEEFAKDEKRLSEQVSDYFNTLGNIAHNDIIGDVELGYETIMNDISHGVGRKKAISFKAVPDVIEKKEIIDTKKIERAENTILLCWQLQSQ